MKKGTPAGGKKKSMRRKGHAVTIHEVALRAGVSPMTVSRVVNRCGSVRESTRTRVLQAVKDLGYTPNLAASTLAAAQGARLALIYTNPSAAYLRELLVGALRGAARNSAQLVIDSWEGHDVNTERAAVQALAKSVAGVILPPPLCESKTLITELTRAGVPVVAIASERFAGQVSTVHIDDLRASRELTAYLIGMGHSRIGYIKATPTRRQRAAL